MTRWSATGGRATFKRLFLTILILFALCIPSYASGIVEPQTDWLFRRNSDNEHLFFMPVVIGATRKIVINFIADGNKNQSSRSREPG